MHILVSPLSQVSAVAERRRPSHLLRLMSLDAETAELSGLDDAKTLMLRFNDIASPREDLVMPGQGHVAEMLEFSRGWPGEAPLLIHCLAGVSRSTAAAYIIACDRAGAGVERILARRLRKASPTCTPNPRMIALADKLLDRDGRMVAAIEDLGRGAPAYDVKPFSLWSPLRAERPEPL